MNDITAIAPLTKVSLKIKDPSNPVDSQILPPAIHFDFVYGIATEGLTAFELTLSGKTPGDRVSIQIEPTQVRPYFEHLLPPLMDALKTVLPSHIDIEIISVSPVTDRELVHALAQKNEGGGCSSGCGCGCG